MKRVEIKVMMKEDDFQHFVSLFRGKFKCDLSEDIVKDLPILKTMYEVTDMHRTGLTVRIHTTGLKSYYYRHANTTKKLGDYSNQAFHDVILKYNKLTGNKSDMTVDEFMQGDFTDEIETLAPSTVRDYKSFTRRFISPAIGSKELNTIDIRDIKSIHNKLKVTPYQANRVLAFLSKMVTFAIDCDLYTKLNPCKKVDNFQEYQRERYLSEDEIQRLFTSMKHFSFSNKHKIHNLMIEFLLHTGCRLSEMLYLKKEQIVNDTITWNKTKTGKKVIPITQKIKDIVIKALSLNSDGNIFNKAYYVSESSLRNYWKELTKHADLKDFRIHDLRHSFASISLESGYSLEHIRVLLGHKSILTTQKYTHVKRSTLVLIMEFVEQQLHFK